jgi:hypothetical protein
VSGKSRAASRSRSASSRSTADEQSAPIATPYLSQSAADLLNAAYRIGGGTGDPPWTITAAAPGSADPAAVGSVPNPATNPGERGAGDNPADPDRKSYDELNADADDDERGVPSMDFGAAGDNRAGAISLRSSSHLLVIVGSVRSAASPSCSTQRQRRIATFT